MEASTEASTQVLASEEVPATPGSVPNLIWEMRAKTHRPVSISSVAWFCYLSVISSASEALMIWFPYVESGVMISVIFNG
jgi:hypothetical protein